MSILVRMPNWLGDAVMATPAVRSLVRHRPAADVVLLCSPPVAAMFAGDPAFAAVACDRSKERRLRPLGIRATAAALRREHGPFEAAIALTNSVSSRWLLRMTGAKVRIGACRGWHDVLLTRAVAVDAAAHQAEIYQQVVNAYLGTHESAGPTTLHVPRPHVYPRRTLGVNPGATYGQAKRWDPARFAAVAAELADRYDIAVFGSANEAAMANEIEQALRQRGVTNVENLAGRTSIKQLLARIAGLHLFITNDSGPMHIAGALEIPTVAIFGPTRHEQTCQWRNPRSAIVRHALPCAPCLRRTCPLGHHACMNDIHPAEVLAAVRGIEGGASQVA